MNDEAAAAWLKAQEALQQCDEVLAVLREREAAGPVSAWVPPQPEPVRRQPEPSTPRPVPPPSPPVADEYTRPRHDSAGRIVEIEKFKGTAAQAARSWQDYIERRIEAFAIGFGEDLGDFVRTDIFGRYDARIASLEARIAELERATGQGLRDAAD